MNSGGDQLNVVVFGATGGIGSACCKLLVDQGFRVVAVGREADRVAALSSSTNCEGATIGDGANFGEVEALLASTKERLGGIQAIVNCIGSVLLKPAHLTSEEEFEKIVRTNLNSAFAVVRAAGKLLERESSVTLVSSAAARAGLANHEAIAAAKAGIIGLTLSAAATYASRGIRLNAVAPGLVETPMTVRITSNEKSRQISEGMHALGRIGTPADIASAIAFLVSPRNNWITGQILGVDGGLGSLQPQPRQPRN